MKKVYYFIPNALEQAFKNQIYFWKAQQQAYNQNENVYVEGEYIEQEILESQIVPTEYTTISNMLNEKIEKIACYPRIGSLVKRTLIGFSLEAVEGQIDKELEEQFILFGVKKFPSETDYQIFRTTL